MASHIKHYLKSSEQQWECSYIYPHFSLPRYLPFPRPTHPTSSHSISLPACSLTTRTSSHRTSNHYTNSKMCFMTDAFFSQCSHWGVPQCESCVRGARSGCWNNTTIGTKRIDGLCPACKYRSSIIASQPQSQINSSLNLVQIVQEQQTQKPQIAWEQSQKQFRITHRTGNNKKSTRPLTRKGLEKRPLTFAMQASFKKANEKKNAIMHLPVE